MEQKKKKERKEKSKQVQININIFNFFCSQSFTTQKGYVTSHNPRYAIYIIRKFINVKIRKCNKKCLIDFLHI